MRAAIALGSNLPSPAGDPAANLYKALSLLEDLGTVTAASALYETEPVGYREQPQFRNAAALLETDLNPRDLMRSLLAIEHVLGRDRSASLPPKGPRTLDLDLLLYENSDGRSLILNDPNLVLPHPSMHERRFVLDPLAEIAPAMLHPILGQTVAQLLAALA